MPLARAGRLLLLAVLLVLSSVARGDEAAPPPRPLRDQPERIDGRVEPTINPKVPSWNTLEERMALLRAANDKRNEILARFPVPIAIAKRVPDGAIRIDGKLDDEAWKDLPEIPITRASHSGDELKLPTTAKLAWDSRYLYVAFDCPDHDVIAKIDEHDGELWRYDVAEVFIDANGDEMSYVEFELAPNGTFYDASIAEYRPEVTWEVNSPHLDMYKTMPIFRTRDTKTAVQVQGTLNQSDDRDTGWTCEMAISWSDLERGTNVNRVPPRDGDVWRMGLYRINVDSDAQASPAEYGAWSPTGTWFHRPYSFGRVVFVE